jgi:chemotaxis protein MotB
MPLPSENQQGLKVVFRRRRAKGHAVHHGGAWKVAYADFVTAMMAFFMLLWLLSNPDKGRLKGLAEYFSTASTSNPETSLTSEPGQDPGIGGHRRRVQGDATDTMGIPSDEAGKQGASRGGTANIPEAARRVLADEMRLAIEPPSDTIGASAAIKVDPTRDGLRVNLMDTSRQSLFVGPTATLSAYGRTLLGQVTRKLLGTQVQIAIEGHTDSTGGPLSAANWTLSSARAMSARAAMVTAGMPETRFAEIVAKAGTDPVYPDQPERPENRRLTIIAIGEPSVLPRDTTFRF